MQSVPNAAEEIAQCLELLESAGISLREALLSRKAEAIWSAVERQEKALVRLEAARRRLAIEEPQLAPEKRNAIYAMAARSRLVQTINARLSHIFVELIDKTVRAINVRLDRNPLTYGAKGLTETNPAPLFVQQAG